MRICADSSPPPRQLSQQLAMCPVYRRVVCRGIRRISFREGLGHMASAVARAYNGGLGAEPPAGSRGRAPGGG